MINWNELLDSDEEYYVPLKFEWKIDPITESSKAIKAWEINQKLKSGYKFRQTVFSISSDMAKAINDINKEKNSTNALT